MSNIYNDIFSLKIKQREPKKGDLLIAEPFLNDEYFQRSVICLVEHFNDISSMGLILNKQSQYQLQDAIEGIEVDVDIPLFVGGPLSDDRLFYLHTLGDLIPDSVKVAPNLYINGDLRVVLSYINSKADIDGVFRFFVGYSGWEKGQLNNEVKQNVWAVLNNANTETYIKGSGENFWQTKVKALGASYRPWLIYPRYPQLN